MSQTSKAFHQAFSNYKLRMEYNKFIGFFKTPLGMHPANVINRIKIDSYGTYCKIISLDKDCIEQITDEPLNFIDDFTSRLGDYGCIFSLHFLYDGTRMANEQVFNTYKEAVLERCPKFPNYDQWLTSTVRSCKKIAIFGGNIDIIKGFFPGIVSPRMLANIFDIVDSAYLFAAKQRSVTAEDIENQKVARQLLAENMDVYKESVRYLLKNGIVFDLSDNRNSGAVSYLQSDGRNISILKFCQRYKNSVSDSVRELFDLILEPELTPCHSSKHSG